MIKHMCHWARNPIWNGPQPGLVRYHRTYFHEINITSCLLCSDYDSVFSEIAFQARLFSES